MEWTANRLIPAILGGGVVIGLLASTAVNTRPKGPPDPPWRLAAREAAFKPSGYTYFDSGPVDLSPNLPLIGTGPDGNVAPMPEDFYRGRVIPIRAGDYAVLQEPLTVRVEPADYAVNEPEPMPPREVTEAAVQPAVIDQPEVPLFAADPPAEELGEDSDFGG